MSETTQERLVTELTPEDIEILTASQLLDIRTVYSNEELVGDEVVALYWNGGMDGYMFKVEKMDDEMYGTCEDMWCYDLELAYMVVFKKDFMKIKYSSLDKFQTALAKFNDAYKELTGVWDELDSNTADLINETDGYPFEKSFNDYLPKMNEWIEKINQLNKGTK